MKDFHITNDLLVLLGRLNVWGSFLFVASLFYAVGEWGMAVVILLLGIPLAMFFGKTLVGFLHKINEKAERISYLDALLIQAAIVTPVFYFWFYTFH